MMGSLSISESVSTRLVRPSMISYGRNCPGSAWNEVEVEVEKSVGERTEFIIGQASMYTMSSAQ